MNFRCGIGRPWLVQGRGGDAIAASGWRGGASRESEAGCSCRIAWLYPINFVEGAAWEARRAGRPGGSHHPSQVNYLPRFKNDDFPLKFQDWLEFSGEIVFFEAG